MDTESTPRAIPILSLQPPSVDFIDNHLSKYHEAFRSHSARYDPSLKRYVPISPIMTSNITPAASIRHYGSEGNDTNQSMIVADPSAVGEVMKFWAALYNDSLSEFKARFPEPKGRTQSPYNIRNAVDWNAIYLQLQLARETYDGNKKGFWGNVKRASRGVADHAASATRLAKFVPEGELTTPIRAAVEVLLDV